MIVLLTKKLPSSSTDLIKSWGWHVDLIEALNITPVEVNELSPTSNAWIISSRNSWPVVQKFIDRAPSFIYCVGRWLPKELRKTRMSAKIADFKDMKSLVAELGKRGFQQVLYFCADNHRDELEQGLKDHPVEIIKVITHESRLTVPVLDEAYDAIFVFSPRSAESLLKKNTFDPQTVFACIGPTTVSYLHEQGITNTFCASRPDNKLLLKEFYSRKISAGRS